MNLSEWCRFSLLLFFGLCYVTVSFSAQKDTIGGWQKFSLEQLQEYVTNHRWVDNTLNTEPYDSVRDDYQAARTKLLSLQLAAKEQVRFENAMAYKAELTKKNRK